MACGRQRVESPLDVNSSVIRSPTRGIGLCAPPHDGTLTRVGKGWVALLCLVGTVGASCGSGSAASKTPTASTATPAAAVSAAAVTNGGRDGAPKPWYRRGKHGWGFDSPTGNIHCYVPSRTPRALFCKALNN